MKPETRRRKEADLRPKQEIAHSFIENLAQVLDGDEGDEIVELFRRAANMEKLAEGWCNDCGGRASVRYPDYRGAGTLLQILFDRVLGKPVQRTEEVHEHKGRIELFALQNASIDELRAIAAEPKQLEQGE